MAQNRPEPNDDSPSGIEETDFSFIKVHVGGRELEVAFPSAAAEAAGIKSCENGHPNVPDRDGNIKCGCGSTEVKR